jgi:hypothetical protein
MPPSPLPDSLHIFCSPEVMAVFSLIDPLGLRHGLTRFATQRLRTIPLAPAIIRAWNKMLSTVAALPARSRSHGGGKAATLAKSQCLGSAPALPRERTQLKSKTKKNFLSGRSQKRKRLKKIHRQNGHQKSVFKPAESDQFQIGTRKVTDFMSDHIINANRRSANEFRVQVDESMFLCAPPTFGH